MRFLFCGSRDWDDADVVQNVMAGLGLGAPTADTVIHGAARGADRLAGEAAVRLGLAVEEYPANWMHHGRGAGHIRNQLMLDEGKPDVVFAFTDNLAESRGTRDMVRRALKAHLPVYVVSRPALEDVL